MNSSVEHVVSPSEVSRQVLEFLYRYQRIDESAQSADDDGEECCIACFESRRAKLEEFVRNEETIHFVIPAFPAKSPNRTKVLGILPDLGERIALGFLQSLCDHVKHFYRPGARITICSDGHVFGDVVGVSDADVTAYRTALQDVIASTGSADLDLFGLDDAFGGSDYPVLRETLERDYCDSLADLKSRVKTDPAARSLFNGIHRFMFEDALGVRPEASKSLVRKESKNSAYHTIRRSNAWSRVVEEKFPHAVRLSIHPQPPHSEKFGIRLIESGDTWLTPWHGVVLDSGAGRSLTKRWQAEQMRASIALRHGRPSHFVAPHVGAAQRGVRS